MICGGRLSFMAQRNNGLLHTGSVGRRCRFESEGGMCGDDVRPSGRCQGDVDVRSSRNQCFVRDKRNRVVVGEIRLRVVDEEL